MKLSVVIPVRNEEKGIRPVAVRLIDRLTKAGMEYEIIIVNDKSTDSTPFVIDAIASQFPVVRVTSSPQPYGFGIAIRKGFEVMTGDAVVVYMGDGSDHPDDVVAYYEKLAAGYDCAFGSRFIRGGSVSGYPWIKLFLNRVGNKIIQVLFFLPYNDVSNAFKGYRVEVIRAVQPLVSQYFNITVEIPLKAIVRGFSYAVVPIHWNGRESGVSKYNIRDLSRKYFFSIFFVWLEKMLLKEELKFKKKE
ncbi:MAG TPA: glycosyltransferase family 2 protein [Candidatus Omnitrophota bacterium]|nr:glycosyltransferase family 2 protein [Candidatus Omnitrophota bacterium]HPT07811.1 glycosyltransferase family 2 protein [Candidatus Omnitrophota bacterium]